MSYTENETQQDITYILHIANEFKDSIDIKDSFEAYDSIDVTNSIEIPPITISPEIIINKGIKEFISYIYALSDRSTSSNYTIVCPRDLMKIFFDTLHTPGRSTTLGSLWSFEVTFHENKTFSFVCDAYSIQDYMKTKNRPRVLQDESLTLWGIFTSLLRSHILPGVSDDLFYVSEKVTSWMTFICLPVLYSKNPVTNVKVSYLLNSGNHNNITLKDKQKKMEDFFDYLFLISTALQQLYPHSRERQQPATAAAENIIDLINEQLLSIIDFFKQGKQVAFIYENKRQQIIFGMVTGTNNVRGIIVPYDQTLPVVFSVPTLPLPLSILSSKIKFYRGMCDPQPNVSLPKISQHCEYLYSNRRGKTTTRDIIQLCSDEMTKAKEKLSNTYLSNCKNRIADTMVPASGGFIKRKRRKTHRKKNTRRKNKKDKTKKKKSPFLYR